MQIGGSDELHFRADKFQFRLRAKPLSEHLIYRLTNDFSMKIVMRTLLRQQNKSKAFQFASRVRLALFCFAAFFPDAPFRRA